MGEEENSSLNYKVGFAAVLCPVDDCELVVGQLGQYQPEKVDNFMKNVSEI